MWLMLPMYILCLVIGLTTTTFGIWYVIDGDPDGILMSVTGLVFVFFGIVLIVSYVRRINTDNRTLKYGRAIPNCVIVDYSDDMSLFINGVPLLKIICKDESTGMLYELNTGTTCELKYPIGAYVTLYELNGYVTLDKNSIKKTGGYTIG